MNRPKHYLIFDVESVGLHGEGFAVGGGVYNPDGDCLYEFAHHCPLNAAKGSDDDRKWVMENVTISEFSIGFPTPKDVRDQFWNEWEMLREKYPGINMAAECGWPVEGRFLNACIEDDPKSRNWEGPYPFHEVASVLIAANMDPMASYDRLPTELPAHEAVNDSRQSARLFFEALTKLDFIVP